MPVPAPPSVPRKTFSENLADRPRARFFTTFAILGCTVTPVALFLIFYNPSDPALGPEAAVSSEVRLEALIGAVLLAAHFLCIFFAWMFYRDEGQKTSD
jgi:hypothetical protein